ncbi:MAG: sodium/glutamate symporter [Agathobacter sp.]
MEIHAVNILYDFALISVLLFIAKIIRAKVKVIQKLYIPAALIAGFIGLFLGNQFLDLLPFSSEISSYSGILIAVLFGTMFLGNKGKNSFKKMFGSVGDTFLVNGAAEIFQYAIFILIGVAVLPVIFSGINESFGMLLPAGFIGGHGTAAAIGGVLADNGWEEAVSIGQTFATIGLLGGILGGVVIINIGARKGHTAIIKNVKDLPDEMLTGLIPEEKRTPMADNTVNSMSIDGLTWHLSLVLIAVGMAYLVNAGLKIVFPQISFPVYGLALLCSIALQAILRLVKLDKYVDKRMITRIGSSATDYLVAFGVASINISVVLKYWLPILVLCIIGFVSVVVWFCVISPRFFRNYWFERGIYILGMSTGVLATGVILLRIADPEFETGVLEDFGFAWIFLSIVDMLIVSFSPVFVMGGQGLPYSVALLAVAIIFLIICKVVFRPKRKFA